MPRSTELAAIRPLVERGIEPQLSLVQRRERRCGRSERGRRGRGGDRARRRPASPRPGRARPAAAGLALAGGATSSPPPRPRLAARQRALPALADRVERTVVRAPLAGRVNRVLVTTVGGSVGPGAPLVEIVPDRGDACWSRRWSCRKDIGFVRIGQQAKVDITAYDSVDLRIARRRASSAISPDAVANERTGESYYIGAGAHRQRTRSDARPASCRSAPA